MRKTWLLLVFISLFMFILAGCNDSESGGTTSTGTDIGTNTDNNSTDNDVIYSGPDSATVSTALTSAYSQLDSLFNSDTAPTQDQIAQTIETIPDISVISNTPDDQGIVAKIGDNGPQIYIPLPLPAGNYDPDQDDISLIDMEPESINTYQTASSQDNLPEKNNVLLLNGLGGNTYKDITPDLKKVFDNYYDHPNYTITRKEATIENLRAVKNVDVLFIKTHGVRTCSVTPYGDPNIDRLATYAISSSTRVNLEDPSPSAYNADINKHNIVFIYAPTEKEGLVFKTYKYEWLYGITCGFVHDYWSLNSGAMAFICSCSSASSEATTFMMNVFDKGASAYIGWTLPIDSDFADNRAQYVFDRLFGANSFAKPSPNQRAFAYPDIEKEMIRRGMVTWPGDYEHAASTLKFVGNPSDDRFGLLAPSIQYMEIDEKLESNASPTLTIHGIFGDVQGHVYLGSDELSVNSWTSSEIECDLSTSDAGDVVVEVNDVKSNKRRITKWECKVTFTAKAPHPNPTYPPQISCNLTDEVVWDLKFRADIATYRKQPGTTPIERKVKFQPTRDSKTTFSSSGSQVLMTDHDGPLTLWTWSGGGTMGVDKSGDRNISHFYGEIDTQQKILKMDILFLGQIGTKTNAFCPGTPSGYTFPSAINLTNSVISGLYDEISPMVAQYIIYTPLDGNWGLEGEQRQLKEVVWDTISNVTATFKWDATPAQYPPVDDNEHGR